MRAYIRKLLGRPVETGAENAVAFVKAVHRKAQETRFVIMDPHDWPWMYNDAWRGRVLELLVEQGSPVSEARFTPPDDLAGWLFDARSTVVRLRVQTLSLDESL